MRFFGETIDGLLTLFDSQWHEIKIACSKHRRYTIDVREYSEAKEISYQQIKWWKGVLLPALSKDSGNSVVWWEATLKLNVLPDDFKPEKVEVLGTVAHILPSVKTLSAKKTNKLIEGSLEYLHEQGFTWVTLPDSSLRKG